MVANDHSVTMKRWTQKLKNSIGLEEQKHFSGQGRKLGTDTSEPKKVGVLIHRRSHPWDLAVVQLTPR